MFPGQLLHGLVPGESSLVLDRSPALWALLEPWVVPAARAEEVALAALPDALWGNADVAAADAGQGLLKAGAHAAAGSEK